MSLTIIMFISINRPDKRVENIIKAQKVIWKRKIISEEKQSNE